MKNSIKLILISTILMFISIIIPNLSKASTPITDEESLNNAISSADVGATVTLQSNITVTKPIVIAKELTIDGNGYTVTGSSTWTSTSGNQTMFTAQFSGAKLTLKNINLQNGPKYGVQSYDGATVILNNVSITGFKYGAVLANGGNIEVQKLHLGYNGTNENNGIEIDKGASATNNPTLTLNGTLTTDTNQNVVRIAENGHLTEFTVTNTPNTTNKIFVAGNKVVLTDSHENVISESNIPDKATGNSDAKSAIITLIVQDKTNKIVVDLGENITADLLRSHITLTEDYTIDGFYTDSDFTTEFNFNDPINADTTIYVKTSKVETTVPETPVSEPESNTIVEEKDETPKTGIQNYLVIALLIILFSVSLIIAINRKELKK